MQSIAHQRCSRQLVASASRLISPRRALVRPRTHAYHKGTFVSFTARPPIFANRSDVANRSVVVVTPAAASTAPPCNLQRQQYRTFSSSNISINDEGAGPSLETGPSFNINAAPSVENELIKAELAGMTGDDGEYDRLVGALSSALDHLEKIQAAQQEDGDALHQQSMIDALQSAGECYWNLGFLDEARDLYEDSLSRLINLHSGDGSHDGGGNQQGKPPDHPAIASTLHWLGSIHARSGHPTEAERWYGSALDMKKRVYGKRNFHPEIGKTLNGLALIEVAQAHDEGGIVVVDDEEAWRRALGLFEEAERNYTYANMDRGGGGRTGIAKPAVDNNAEDILSSPEDEEDYSNHPDLAMIYENMALLFRRNNEHKAALARYREALEIRRTGSDADVAGVGGDGKILDLMLGIADCLRALSKFDEASELYEQVLESHIKDTRRKAEQAPQEGVETRTALEVVLRHNIGLVHAQCGRHDLALEEYNTAREIKIALAGPDHPEVAVTLNAAGAVHGASGDREKALSYFRQALQIFQFHSGALGDNDPDVVNTQRNIRLIEKSALKSGKEDRLTLQ